MDLETIIPLAIVAIAYLFKAFDSARKKDAKKTPPAPGRPSAPAKPASARRTDARPIPRTNTAQTARPDAKPLARADARPAPRSIQKPAPAPPQIPEGQWWEESSPARETSAPRRELHESARALSPASVRASAAVARHQRNPAAAELIREPEETNEYADFDLRDAVIKSVILERRDF